MEELKPCPFCGEMANYDCPSKNQVRIFCTKCTCQISGKFLRETREWLLQKLIVRWNTRPNDGGEIEELKQSQLRLATYITTRTLSRAKCEEIENEAMEIIHKAK